MRAVLPGRPPAKLQSFSTTLWDGLRVIAYISGHALVILGGPQTLLQTIYVDDTDKLEAVAFDEASGRIAVSGGPDVFIYEPWGVRVETLKWSLVHTFRADDDDNGPIRTLSWGAGDELLVGNSHLALWALESEPKIVWQRKLGTPVIFAEFSPDAALVVTVGQYDRLAKIWRRLAFGTNEVRFEVSYLPHPNIVTGIHWRLPHHREQSMDNVLYTLCADNKIRVWAATDHHALSPLQLWVDIDMEASLQPRDASGLNRGSQRRYGFILDSRDFCAATERAVERNSGNKENHALEHLIEVANKSPEICMVTDSQGHISAWALEDIGSKTKTSLSLFNILHVEGLDFGFMPGLEPEEDYARISTFQSSTSDDKISVVVHHFDGRIECLMVRTHCPVKKIVRNATGHTLVSRTNENTAMIWKQKRRESGSMLIHKSTLRSEEHIHRTCVIENCTFLVNLHHDGVSLWDYSSYHARKLASLPFSLSSKPLCVLPLPTPDGSPGLAYVATIAADMHGIAWELEWQTHGGDCQIRKFCEFDMGLREDLAYILPVDPAGPKAKHSGSFDAFSPDIALSYTLSGIVRTWTAKVDRKSNSVEWLLKSTVDTGIENPSLASGSTIRKAALIDASRTHLTIWDINNAQLEFEEQFAPHDIIRDLDWTSTPDMQSILAVGFPHKVILLSQLRYDYLDAQPSWTQIREIWIRDLTPHPIGDSCWLTHGNLVIGAGNQLFVYDKDIDVSDHLVSELRIPSRGQSFVDLFDVVSRLNGPLPAFHPQFLAQCILAGKSNLVHSILLNLHHKLKFYTEGDELDGLLEMPLEHFYEDKDVKMLSSHVDGVDDESFVVDENIAANLNENLARIALPQLSSHEQFHLVDTIECVATVEKHRRSMDDNAARYFLFFRQHMLRRSQGMANKETVSWREIVWAYHSGSQDILTDLVSRQFSGKMTWKAARESGLFMWLADTVALKNILQGLWRIAHWNREQKPTQKLLANDFKEARWRTAALKNAYALLGKRRFVGDIQLAIAITRVYEGDNGPVLRGLLEERILPQAATDGNRWMASWAFWMLGRRDMAVRALIVRSLLLGLPKSVLTNSKSPIESLLLQNPTSPGTPGRVTLQSKSYLSNDPALVALYRQLREKTLQTLKGASQIRPGEEWEFVLRNARLYDRMGCDLLALDLVRRWEFLASPFTQALQTHPAGQLHENGVDYRKLLRRRSSLVVADMPIRLASSESENEKTGTAYGADGSYEPKQQAEKSKPPPTMFHEPDANSLLDSFGF
ncbi:hypothetical protein N7468_002408 [Penicillium chermesinum]|uniref:RAVE complex protein Rav1 C-terminal domain-containing protein n=1 Tax=Penicillium chermesinum TaxID=63820 RepID=A0A9W9PIL3_9EURO|nr:uncharacterized protein N7468_002408 [Penicillium chermesinum]KAJ5247425.1 hypothetical protein N7468_002408 [Penicillium chermesinum]